MERLDNVEGKQLQRMW